MIFVSFSLNNMNYDFTPEFYVYFLDKLLLILNFLHFVYALFVLNIVCYDDMNWTELSQFGTSYIIIYKLIAGPGGYDH